MSRKGNILVTSFQSLTPKSAGGMARLGYYVSDQLHRRGLLRNFVVYSKGKFDTAFPSIPVSPISRYYLFALNKLNKIFKVPDHKFRLIQEKLYDKLCAKRLTGDIKILFTTNAHMYRTFTKAKKLGIPIIYVPANPEEHFIFDLVTEENAKLGIKSLDAYNYLPRLHFYNDSISLVDTIIGTYPTVYKSYKEYSNQYDLVEITGHLKPDFKDYQLEDKPISEELKVVYVATTVVLKGLQYLLEAWKLLKQEHPDKKLQLYIVGNIETPIKNFINENYAGLQDVTYTGRIPDVAAFLKDKDLSVVPSLTDGGPYVALEAAHYGIPVILTNNCGSAELLSRNASGCIVIPIRDAKAIRDKILWAYNYREEAKQMGINAKKNLDSYDMDELIMGITDYLEQYLNEKDAGDE